MAIRRNNSILGYPGIDLWFTGIYRVVYYNIQGCKVSLLGYTVHMYLVFIVNLKDGSVVGEIIHQLFSLFQKIIS